MFRRTELLALTAVTGMLAADLAIIVARAQPVAWTGYLGGFLLAIGAIALGAAYRRSGRNEGIALATIACGIFILFTVAGSVFNYLLFPLAQPTIDPLLAALDARAGYSWPHFVEAVAAMPPVGPALAMVYMSSLPQMVAVIVLLGFTRRELALDRFLLTGIAGACLSIAIWWSAPSFGPSVLYPIEDEVARSAWLVVGPAYGAELERLALEGPRLISPDNVLGVIAFPSFHTVMACMAVWFTRQTRLRVPFLLVNLAMMPAILAHGGHHLVDIAGGIGVFLVALGLATALAPARSATESGGAGLSPARP